MAKLEKKKQVTLFVRVSPEIHKHLIVLAARRGIPREELYRECLSLGLNRWFKQGEAFDAFNKHAR